METTNVFVTNLSDYTVLLTNIIDYLKLIFYMNVVIVILMIIKGV